MDFTQHCGFDPLQRQSQPGVNLQLFPFPAQKSGEAVNVILGLRLEIRRRHDLPENLHPLVCQIKLHVAQQIPDLPLYIRVRQHLLIDTVVGAGVADCDIVGLGLNEILRQIDRHQKVEQTGDNRQSQEQPPEDPQQS